MGYRDLFNEWLNLDSETKDELLSIKDEKLIDALYEVLINEDYDYIENLFTDKEYFDYFIEKYKETK